MADESVERRDTSSGSTGQPPHDDEINKAGSDSNRRRLLITSLLAAPAVMTLNVRSARARHNPRANNDPTPTASCTNSVNPSHTCM